MAKSLTGRVVVTGAAGFIGSALVKELLKEDGISEVVGIDRFSDYYSPALKRGNLQGIDDKRFRLIEGDLTEVDLSGILADVAVVFHQAGQPGVRPSWGRQFDTYISDNVVSTQRILEAVVACPQKPKLVYASSSSVYGDADVYPTTEDTLPRPRSPYGVTKLASEHMVTLYAKQFGVQATSLRYFTVYGPGQRPDMAFTRFCNAALVGDAIDVYGDGNQIREFTFVGDIVRANLLAAEADTQPGLVLNISGGSAVKLTDCIDLIEKIGGRKIRKNYLSSAAGDVIRTGATGEKARSLLGWVPSVTIETGLAAQFEWARSVPVR